MKTRAYFLSTSERKSFNFRLASLRVLVTFCLISNISSFSDLCRGKERRNLAELSMLSVSKSSSSIASILKQVQGRYVTMSTILQRCLNNRAGGHTCQYLGRRVDKRINFHTIISISVQDPSTIIKSSEMPTKNLTTIQPAIKIVWG